MTKQQLVDNLSKEAGMTRRQIEDVLAKMTAIIGRTIKAGEKVSITGFGTFDLGKRAARRGINPQTGTEIRIPEMPMPRFRAGKRLKETVRPN